jgi:hypothetical protein
MTVILSLLTGAALGTRYTVYILVPAISSVVFAAVIVATLQDYQFWSLIPAIILTGMAIQLGYLFGALAPIGWAGETQAPENQDRQLVGRQRPEPAAAAEIDPPTYVPFPLPLRSGSLGPIVAFPCARGLLQRTHAGRSQAARRLPERVKCKLGRQSHFATRSRAAHFAQTASSSSPPAPGSAESHKNHIEPPNSSARGSVSVVPMQIPSDT